MSQHPLNVSAILEQLLAILPEQTAATLLALISTEHNSPEQIRTVTQTVIKSIDWNTQREQIGELIGQMMPLELLVPEIYRAWRPVVRDAVIYIGSHLSPVRLVPKLIEQITLPLDLPLEQRLIILIARMPSLQKIGQIVARNQQLDPEFRQALIHLENAIRDTTPPEIQAEIKRQIKSQIDTYKVELDDQIQAEASVSAVMRFSWLDPATSRREPGILKVLKPYIHTHFQEELELLRGLAEFFDSHRSRYVILSGIDLRVVFDDIRLLLEQEVDLVKEQASLNAAHRYFSSISGIRTPRLIQEFSTPAISAMTEEHGIKATEAFSGNRFKRTQVAARIIEALVAIPLFAEEEKVVFHADPHAGNLFVDEAREEVIILDWALTESLSRQERRNIIVYILAVALRDEWHIRQAINGLTRNDLSRDRDKTRIVQRCVREFVDQLSPLSIPTIATALTLLHTLSRAGIRFSTPLLIFRKVLFTLEGVLQDIAPGMPMEAALGWYVVRQRAKSGFMLSGLSSSPPHFRSPLSNLDRVALLWSAQTFGLRTGLQSGRRLRRRGLRNLRRFFLT